MELYLKRKSEGMNAGAKGQTCLSPVRTARPPDDPLSRVAYLEETGASRQSNLTPPCCWGRKGRRQGNFSAFMVIQVPEGETTGDLNPRIGLAVLTQQKRT